MRCLGQAEHLTQTGSDDSPKGLLFYVLDREGDIPMTNMIYMDDLGAKSAQDHFFLRDDGVLICFWPHHLGHKS